MYASIVNKPRPTIIVDVSQCGSGMHESLRQAGIREVQVADLEAGHYVIAGGMAVMHMTMDSFRAAIADATLFDVVPQMARAYSRAFVIIEGDSLLGGADPVDAAETAAISWLAVLSGVHVLRTKGRDSTVRMLAEMARHAQTFLGHSAPTREAGSHPERSMTEFILQGFPSIGPRASKALLDQFGSLAGVFAAPMDDLMTVSGLCKEQATSIRSLLTCTGISGEGR